MIGAKMDVIFLATATAQAPVAPASAAWAQLDVGIGLSSIVIICIFIGACAAVLRDRQTHSGTLFGTFFTALITTIAAVYFVLRRTPGFEEPAAQAIAGMLLAYNAQLWAGRFTKKFISNNTDSQSDADRGDAHD